MQPSPRFHNLPAQAVDAGGAIAKEAEIAATRFAPAPPPRPISMITGSPGGGLFSCGPVSSCPADEAVGVGDKKSGCVGM